MCRFPVDWDECLPEDVFEAEISLAVCDIVTLDEFRQKVLLASIWSEYSDSTGF